jgi:hypothetical protein
MPPIICFNIWIFSLRKVPIPVNQHSRSSFQEALSNLSPEITPRIKLHMKLKTLSLLSAAIGMSAPFASAAISVVNVASATFNDGTATSKTFTYTPTTAGNVLVFATYVDNGSPGYVTSSVLFDGVAATGVTTTSRTMLAYTYTSDASVTVTFDITTGNATTGYVIYELSGVDTTQLATLSTGATTTTTADGQFVVDFLGVNNGGLAPVATPATGSIITTSSQFNMNPAGGGGYIAYGTGTAGTAGSQTLGWTLTDGASSGEISAAFTAAVVPEPSVALLGAFGAMTLLRRRRA